MNEPETDRYLSFTGIACDENADKLIGMLELHLTRKQGSKAWQQYFRAKLNEQKRMQHDNLNFVGCQTNPLYEYFGEVKDHEATKLLYRIEQECC